MNTENDRLHKKIEDDKDDATKPFSNAEKSSAAEINRGGDAKSRNFLGKDNTGEEGPNFKKKSKEVDGDTGQNAGVFK